MGEDRGFWAWFIVLCAVLLVGLFMVLPAFAQGIRCQPFAQMKAMLAGQYQEREVAHGIVNPQQIFVLFASDRGKTWTMLSVNTAGLACAVQAGQHWTSLDRGA